MTHARPILSGVLTAFTLILSSALSCAAAQARENLWIISSAADFSYTAAVGESFARKYRLPAPFIERYSPRNSVRLFCAGLGSAHPDVVGLPRRLWQSEIRNCRVNGVTRVTEVKVGYDAVVLAQGGDTTAFTLTRVQLFKALAAELLVEGELVENPHRTWHDIDPALPDHVIKVYGPAPFTDFGVLFLTDVMIAGCRAYLAGQHAAEERRGINCSDLRRDGAYLAQGRWRAEALRRALREPGAMTVLPFSAYRRHGLPGSAVALDGVVPDEVSIAMGDYPALCPIYIYVKSQHFERLPGILEFVTEYTSDWAWAPGGYLVEAGLVPLSQEDRIAQRSNAIGLNPIW